MTEREAINTRELHAMESAINLLRDIVPECSVVIDPEEFQMLRSQLYTWRSRLRATINIEENELHTPLQSGPKTGKAREEKA
jgi:hypothetical protein